MGSAELAIIVPTFKERDNIAGVIEAVDAALPGVAWEIVFVDDDSPDQTAEVVREHARRDPRVRVVHRVGRRGLSSACVEGVLATAAPIIAVMDADRQHDERALVKMLEVLRTQPVDLVVGSRYVDGGGIGDWDKKRAAMSRFATQLANRITGTPISDPMSGFFMLRREAFMAALPDLSSIGFKILLDIAASTPQPLRIAEVPYEFRSRVHGESKLDSVVLWEYLLLLLDKAIGHIVPVRFISFALVGGSGVFVSMTVLFVLFKGLHTTFQFGQTVATIVAITTNFLLNNALTYRDRRLKGWKLFLGWLTFNLVSAVGAIGNVGIASYVMDYKHYHGSWIVSALAGIAVGVVWNYAASAIVTWRKK
ncbi:glycosyltransferase family 2 protein [Sphingomonas sp. ID0503]|uniref:glycosyltransferase family 2 protein n=1 Tax=Sphingomonas sp. ID0503 TaxID=3399691 RepID=UPI003AFA98B1